MRNIQYIVEYKKAFSLDDCHRIIEKRVSASDKQPYEDIVYWKHKSKNTEWSFIVDIFLESLKPIIDQYLGQFAGDLDFKDLDLLGVALMRHPAGTYDNHHFDTPVGISNNNHVYRPFVCLVYLNGEDIEGGQLVFPAQGKIIEPEGGKCVLFPCSFMFPHKVATVSSGERLFVRFNFKFKSDNLIDRELDEWDVTKNGVSFN